MRILHAIAGTTSTLSATAAEPWPEKPMPPGEYALIEYTEGKVNVQVWDFFIK